MDLKTITTTLALLGCGATLGCGGDTKKTEVKTETKTEVKAPDVKEVTPAAAATPAAADAKAEMKCGEGKCGEGKCGGEKTEGDGKAVPVDAAKPGAEIKPAEKPAEKPADKT